MSDSAFSDRRTRHTVSMRARMWFAWMVVMWAAFFALLATGHLDGLWSAIRDLPLVAQILLWIPFLPWMLGMAVWASSWGGATMRGALAEREARGRQHGGGLPRPLAPPGLDWLQLGLR